MSKSPIKKRVSKGQWLDTAMEVLARSGIEAVRIESMAEQLGIAKSGFYWHFKDRNDLYRQMLKTWEHETTLIITGNPEISSKPAIKRLEHILQTISDFELARAECAIAVWSCLDAVARKTKNRVYNARTNFVRAQFEELGFKGDELEMRTQLFTVYANYEYATYSHLPKSKRCRLIKRLLRLLTQK